MERKSMRKALKVFGETVRDLRKNLKLTQEQLGETCGRHPVYVSEMERGVKNPSLESILRLCQALKITPGDLMDLAFPSDVKDLALKKKILTLVSQQGSEDLKKLLAIVKAYLENE